MLQAIARKSPLRRLSLQAFRLLADGVLQLCVIGRDAAGNWQTEAGRYDASWTKDITLPWLRLSGEPTGTSNATTLNVTVAGTGVTEYKYKIRVPLIGLLERRGL